MDKSERWYSRPIWIIAMCIFFFPAGIYLIWKHGPWVKSTKYLLTAAILVYAVSFVGIASDPTLNTSQKVTQATNKIEPVFDMPNLVNKNLDQLTKTLGSPLKSNDPTKLQIELGAKTWDKTYEVNKHKLLVTYEISSKKIIDFFISTENPSGTTKDKNELLQLGNLQENAAEYSIEYVRAIKDPTSYTGVKILPR